VSAGRQKVIPWKRGLTIEIDPFSQWIYTLDATSWLDPEDVILGYELIAEEPLEIPYQARSGFLISFQVTNAVEGERRGVTVRVRVAGPVQQEDNRTVFFIGRPM